MNPFDILLWRERLIANGFSPKHVRQMVPPGPVPMTIPDKKK